RRIWDWRKASVLDLDILATSWVNSLAGVWKPLDFAFVHRLRPYDAGVTHLLIAPSHDPSFPSDHSTAVFSIAFAYLLPGCRVSRGPFAGVRWNALRGRHPGRCADGVHCCVDRPDRLSTGHDNRPLGY